MHMDDGGIIRYVLIGPAEIPHEHLAIGDYCILFEWIDIDPEQEDALEEVMSRFFRSHSSERIIETFIEEEENNPEVLTLRVVFGPFKSKDAMDAAHVGLVKVLDDYGAELGIKPGGGVN